ELLLDGRTLHNVVLGGSRDGLTWRANIDATELNGYVEFRQPGGAGSGRLYGRLSRLSLGQGTASEVEAILDEQPAGIPALDIVVEDLELRGKKFGRVEIEAINRGAGTVAREGGVREWRLNKLNIIMPEATLTANGNWVAVNAQQAAGAASGGRVPAERRRTVMNFRLDIDDSGELLRRFGMADVIRRGKGRLEGQIAWMGSPLSLDYPSLNGQFNVNVASGQFLKADPGIAKLLGVLSLQALPRRLALDFRDVFSEGFSFDFVRGDVSITQGLAFTNNLQMKGVNAAVLMEGSADIAKETQNLTVVVVPEINAGTASLIATVINPAIGIGTFLAQYFLRRPLTQAATQEFHIDGTWANPKITKLERKPPPAAKAGEETGEK
ncbi:MAG: AsmA-like C-terminal region-containing protein, partial [Polaromonas sp.]|nr:AsmA-like C-terminal region-containing protein [Polaromonas sp.]